MIAPDDLWASGLYDWPEPDPYKEPDPLAIRSDIDFDEQEEIKMA